ncbi:cell division protein FtsL [Oceanobacter kriegii]|uniref:cell division protein FtsL n=1 Tax=Oceanobacter kriegii TaxID=64972 RepID=UPI0004259EED|nr:cell division protein FtsL [Oceanobacter kriegii]
MSKSLFLVWFAVIVSALVQVGLSHQHRDRVQIWQKLESRRDALQDEQTRLVLELGTLTSYGRVDQRARTELNMKEPVDIRILKP